MDDLSRITIIAIGVENYQNMRRLLGPTSDVDNLYNLLVKDENTALFEDRQFIKIINPTSDSLRQTINDYLLGRSASGDILFFYFSGHGVPLGTTDFGLCAIDTNIHPGSNITLPFTVLKISDLLETLSIMGVTPVIVLDACYSGQAGKAVIGANDAFATIKKEATSTSASAYALLCSCTEYQTTEDTKNGGVFSNLFFSVLASGLENQRQEIFGLYDVFTPLKALVEKTMEDSYPLLFLGQTMPDFPLVFNINYVDQVARSYSLVGHLSKVLIALWNNGKERELTPDEIRQICGNGAYGNHQKLSLEPWRLVENVGKTTKRRLTERGRQFINGKLSVPRAIMQNPITKTWEPAVETNEIQFAELLNKN